MTLTVANYIGVKIDDLQTPSETQKYPLGFEVAIVDPLKKMLKKFVYVYASVALTKYQPYIVAYSGTVGQEVLAKIPAHSPDIPLQCVCLTACPLGYYCFVQTQGETRGLVEPWQSFLNGEFLATNHSNDNFQRSAGVGEDSYANSAIALEDYTDSVGVIGEVKIMLLGRWFVIS